ncbi:hypothetical protein MTR67_009035, partial [Solanum verrucosum]
EITTPGKFEYERIRERGEGRGSGGVLDFIFFWAVRVGCWTSILLEEEERNKVGSLGCIGTMYVLYWYREKEWEFGLELGWNNGTELGRLKLRGKAQNFGQMGW